MNIDEKNFCLKSKYSAHNEEPRISINDIPSEEPSFEAIIGYLKTFSKSIKEDENMSLKNKCLIGGWILMASKVYRQENLSCRFEDWLYCLCKIKRQTSYNYRNLFKQMSVAPKLMNCSVNTTYSVKTVKISWNILMNRKHRHPGNMCFLIHVGVVFRTLENQLLYKEILLETFWVYFNFQNRKLCLGCLVLFYLVKALCKFCLCV